MNEVGESGVHSSDLLRIPEIIFLRNFDVVVVHILIETCVCISESSEDYEECYSER